MDENTYMTKNTYMKDAKHQYSLPPWYNNPSRPPSTFHRKLAAEAICLEQILVHLEGWCQTELLMSGLLSP